MEDYIWYLIAGFIVIIIIIGTVTWVYIYKRQGSNSNDNYSRIEETQPLVQEGQNQKSNLFDAGLNKEIAFNKRKFSHNAGIPNYRNTCYLNSTIQALVCIPEFVDLVSKSNSDLFKFLSQIFALVLSNASKDSFKPLIKALLNELKRNYSMFARGNQNDCKELYSILINKFFTECEEKNFFLIKKNNLFICEKGHDMTKGDEQLFLVIPPNTKLDSEKCIQDIKENETELELFCKECDGISKTKMLTESLELPEYLVFYVADTTNKGRVSRTRIKADEKEYDLFGVICHYGDQKSGHYIAFTLNEDREWIQYNDADVNKEDPDYNHAYMLFYKQRIY